MDAYPIESLDGGGLLVEFLIETACRCCEVAVFCVTNE